MRIVHEPQRDVDHVAAEQPHQPRRVLVEQLPAAVLHRVERRVRQVHLVLLPVHVLRLHHVHGTLPARDVPVPRRLDLADGPERAGLHVVERRLELPAAPPLRAHLHDPVGRRLDDVVRRPGVLEPRAERLFDVGVLARLHGVDEHGAMRVVGRRDDHGVEAGHREQVVIPRELLRPLPLLLGQRRRHLVARHRPHVAHADDVHLARAGGHRLAEDVGAADAAADDAEVDLVVRRHGAGAPGGQGRGRQAHPGGEEVSTGKTRV